jgi:hypothetical protein
MLYPNDAAVIAQRWQGQLDESLEAGETLWIEGGLSRRTVDHLPLLLALDQFARQRADVTTPGLFVGGDGIVWSAALLSQVAAPNASPTTALTLLYGGADQASYLATLATLPGPSTHTRRQAATGLLVGMQAHFLPASQPGAAPAWSALPFALAERSSSQASEQSSGGETWLPWLTILVVIGLIITALFV